MGFRCHSEDVWNQSVRNLPAVFLVALSVLFLALFFVSEDSMNHQDGDEDEIPVWNYAQASSWKGPRQSYVDFEEVIKMAGEAPKSAG